MVVVVMVVMVMVIIMVVVIVMVVVMPLRHLQALDLGADGRRRLPFRVERRENGRRVRDRIEQIGDGRDAQRTGSVFRRHHRSLCAGEGRNRA